MGMDPVGFRLQIGSAHLGMISAGGIRLVSQKKSKNLRIIEERRYLVDKRLGYTIALAEPDQGFEPSGNALTDDAY